MLGARTELPGSSTERRGACDGDSEAGMCEGGDTNR